MGLIGIVAVIVVGGLALKGLQVQMQETPIVIVQPPVNTTVPVLAESRFDRAPQPLRDWMAPPEFPPRGGIATIPINIPTQGLPESFQSMGNISVGGGKMLPLYGRRTMRGSSDRWNYYTRTDTYNPVPLPIRYKNRDCMDDIGCAELYSGETVHLEGTGEHGAVRIFRFDGPKYIPGLV
jgi:hypothetical protein